ncbi:MAG: MBL fold metallo-hydrolase [Armatimonadetes bacterium]|nr:MBL fold metallo-hydrolase [Armatimonadota bacterium]
MLMLRRRQESASEGNSPGIRESASMKLQFLGGASEVGASCAVVESKARRAVIDAGIRMSSGDADRLPDLARLQEAGPPEAVLVTHAHTDHIGALPLVHLAFPEAPVITTEPTLDLMRVLLQDSLKIMNSRWQQEQEIPLYPREAVEGLLARVQTVPPAEKIPLCSGEWTAVFHPTGHVLGACSILLDTPEGRLFFTGDYSLDRQQTVEGMYVPRCHPHVVVTEATYGNRLHANRRAEEERLARTVAEVVEGGGKALIPAFALGRAQEVILILLEAQRSGAIPRFPIHVDGMVKNVCAIYSAHGDFLARPLRRKIAREGNPFFQDGSGAIPVLAPQRQQVLDGPPCAIVSSSGMLTGGPSVFYAAALAAGERNAILITGYQDEESPGRQVQELARKGSGSLRLNGREVAVQCRVGTYGLSAHADQMQMAGVVERLNPQEVLLVHGDEPARRALAGVLAGERMRIHLPQNGDAVDLGNYRAAWRGVTVRRPGLGRGSPFDVAALRGALLSRGKATYTVRDLAEAWYGSEASPDNVEEVRQALCRPGSGFLADRRRPYLYRALTDGEVQEAEEAAGGRRRPDGKLEMNEALAVVDELLGSDPELYKKGAYAEEGELLLSFHFPEPARERHAALFEELAHRTGWTVRLNSQAHLGAIGAAVEEVLPEGWCLAKQPSIYAQEQRVRARVRIGGPADPARRQQVETAFLQRTGFRLNLEEESGTPTAASIFTSSGRMEQNVAFTRIREVFQKQGVEVTRTSLVQEAGPCIEIALISPQVAARHVDLLKALEEETRWNLRFAREPNQHLIKQRVREILPREWGLKKEPGFLKAEGKVRLKLSAEPSPEDLAPIRARVLEATGMELEIG